MNLVAPRHVGSSRTRDGTCVSCISRWILYHWGTWEACPQSFDALCWLFSFSVGAPERLFSAQKGNDIIQFQFSRSVVSNSLWPHGLQYDMPPYPTPTPRVHPNPCPLSQWCHPTISSSAALFSSCPQFFPASGFFPVSKLFLSGGKIIELQLQQQSLQRIFKVDFL